SSISTLFPSRRSSDLSNWVLGKSGLKALQYMAVGLPVVATAIGVNYRIIEDGKTGFLVKTEEEWIEKLNLLMDHSELRKNIGLADRKSTRLNSSHDQI